MQTMPVTHIQKAAHMHQYKQAGAFTDAATGHSLYSALPIEALPYGGIIGAVDNAGQVIGMFADPADEETKQHYKYNPGFSYVPGVAGYRYQRLRSGLAKEMGAPNRKDISEAGGEASGMLIGSGVGALAGYALGGDSRSAIIGAIGGAVIPHVLGLLLAGLTPTRTTEEQQGYEQYTDDTINWLMPGAAIYNKYKSIGYMRSKEDRAEERERQQEFEETQKARK